MAGILKIRDPNTGEFIAIPAIQGEQGPQGVSPTVTVDAIEGGHRVTITDANGTQSFDVMDGVDGQDGAGGSGSSVELDATLTQSGKAADAKVVGDQLSALNEAKANNADLAAVAKSGSYNDLSNKPTIPTVPTTLPNPNKLKLTGAVTAEYDGSAEVSVEIPDGGSGGYNLPIASPTTLGGVQPVAKTDEMTQSVGVDEAGGLWTAKGTGSGEREWAHVASIITEEDVLEVKVPTPGLYDDVFIVINFISRIKIKLNISCFAVNPAGRMEMNPVYNATEMSYKIRCWPAPQISNCSYVFVSALAGGNQTIKIYNAFYASSFHGIIVTSYDGETKIGSGSKIDIYGR